MKALILWTQPSGYLAACVRELSRIPNVDVTLVCHSEVGDTNYNLHQLVLDETEVLQDPSASDWAALESRSFDKLLICGWHVAKYRRFARARGNRSRRVLHFDNHWRGDLRQRLGVLTAPVFLRPAYDSVFVPGERQSNFARRLGFSDAEISLGSYCCDVEAFERVPLLTDDEKARRRRFIFVGRLAPEKGLTDLAAAYREYRRRSGGLAWELCVVGRGPLREFLQAEPGVVVTDFVQPAALPGLLGTAGTFVFPSRFEPWGVALHEATAAGLPVIVSRAVGASDRFVVDGANGVLVEPGSITDLTNAMALMHEAGEQLVTMSGRSRELAEGLTPRGWAETFLRA